MASLSISNSRAPQTHQSGWENPQTFGFYHRMDPDTDMPIRLSRVGGWGDLNKSRILITLQLSAVLWFLKCPCLRNLSQASRSLVGPGSLKYYANCFCYPAWSSLHPAFSEGSHSSSENICKVKIKNNYGLKMQWDLQAALDTSTNI